MTNSMYNEQGNMENILKFQSAFCKNDFKFLFNILSSVL